MENSFLGVGWSYPLAVSADSVALSQDEEKIRQSIWIILQTAPGERLMRPTFGCGLQNYLFAPQTISTWNAIAASVERALRQWEPRIELLGTSATRGGKPDEILINIEYRIAGTTTERNLVYPFYLDGAQ